MRVINTSVNTLSTRYLVIGFEGENERTQIRIDAASVFDEYPQASPSMAVKPGFGEEVYPVIVTKEGNEVVWDVTQDNLDFTGDGEIQLTFIKDNVICKTTIGKIRVNRSLIVNGDPPEHLDTWYEEATEKLADVDAAVYSLEALDATASGLPAGSSPTVEVQDVNDHKRLAFGIPKGDRGDRGPTGNGIRSISQSGSTGLYKKYTIHYTDGTTTTFQVRDGDRGLKGDTGATPDIGIGTVETLPAGSEATASMSGTAENPRLNLGIPKGDQGIQGEKGDKGDRGATPVFSMGAVTNLPAGSSATATITGTAEEPVLNLGIPKGDKGDKGDRGERGPQGIQGIQGDRGLTGPRGEQGQKGDKGDTGATGATGATPDFSIGTVSTLPAGSSATAEITGTAENPVLSLGIPQGAQGIQGVQGEKGDPGDGVPAGGLTGQVLAKASDADRNTEWVHVAPVIKNEASGSIASFSDGAEMPVDEVTAQINPVQDLHGYDYPWPAGGGVNKFAISDAVGVIVTSAAYGLSIDLDAENETIRIHGTPTWSGNSSYTFRAIATKNGYWGYASVDHDYSDYKAFTEVLSKTSNVSSAGSFYVLDASVISISYLTVTDANAIDVTYRLSLNPDATPTSWTPYSNICPITGWDGVQVWDDPVHGGNVEWNQHLDPGVKQFTALANSNSTYYLTGVIDGKHGKKVAWVAGNKYLFLWKQLNTMTSNIRNGAIYNDGTNHYQNFIGADARLNAGVYSWVFAPEKSVENGELGLWVHTPDINVGYTDFCLFNLTQMFGATKAEEIYAMEQANAGSGVAYFRSLFPDDYYPYNLGEITTVSAVNGDPYRHYSITLPSEAGTVYGGSLSIAEDGSGVLTVDRAMVDLGTLTWYKIATTGSHWRFWAYLNEMAYDGEMLSSQYKHITATQSYMGEIGIASQSSGSNYLAMVTDERFSDADTFKTAMSGVQLVYELATPLTYTLTASQITTLLGTNNVWSDAGDVSVKYKADTKLYIDGKIAELVAQIVNS